MNMIDIDAIYAYVKNDIETINDMLTKQMLNSIYGTERRANMPTTCRTCSIVYQVNNPACRACMRKRDEEAQRNYYTRNNLSIKNVIFNPPATIVFWEDNTKTVVKCQGEIFDPEKGLTMAFMKKALGNQGNYFDTVKKWTEKYETKKMEEVAGFWTLGYIHECLKHAGLDVTEKVTTDADNAE